MEENQLNVPAAEIIETLKIEKYFPSLTSLAEISVVSDGEIFICLPVCICECVCVSVCVCVDCLYYLISIIFKQYFIKFLKTPIMQEHENICVKCVHFI